MMSRLNLINLTLSLVFITLLSSCTDVVTTGAQALYNRRNIQKNFSDQYITMQAFKAIHGKDKRFQDTNIAIATYHGEVLLAGQAPQTWQREKVETLVKTIPNVKRVYNLVTIEAPSSSLKRISDSWITAKVKAKLISSNDVDASQIKVVTENGTVYLMGILPPNEAEEAAELASNTGGVEKVVKVFSYIHITKKA